jgi:DNA-binding MarR family transcriptional regulator
VQSPSIQQEYYSKLRSAFSGTDLAPERVISVLDLVPTKLPSTAIFILLHILNSKDFTSYARFIEAELNLSKSTVSYNLNLLENEALIERKTILEEDQRLKAVKICTKGIEYLFAVYLELDRHFTR